MCGWMDGLSISQVSVATLLRQIVVAYNQHLFLMQSSAVSWGSCASASDCRSGSDLLSVCLMLFSQQMADMQEE